ALNLMNDAMVYKLAKSFADRVRQEVGNDQAREIERVYWLALSRAPSVEEKRVGLDTLNKLTIAEGEHERDEDRPAQNAESVRARLTPVLHVEKKTSEVDPEEAAHRALAKFCQTLVNSAAFIYID